MKQKYKLIISLLVIVFLISSILLISYGFIGSEVTGNEKAKEFVNLSQILKVEYSGGNETINTLEEGYFTPGSILTKTFSVKNTGNVNINYGIKLSEVKNDFERQEDLIYELYLDNTLLISDIMPNKDTVIAYSQTIKVGETKNYVLKIIYKESNENQIIDQNKLLSAKIDFVQTKNVLSNIKIIGNSSQGKESLFDKENATILQAYINTSANQLGYPYTDSTTFLIPCEKNTKYLVSYDYNSAKTSIFRTGYITVNDPTAKNWNNVYGTDYTANIDHYVTTDDKATFIVVQVGSSVHKKVMESLKVELVISPETPKEIISAGDKTVNIYEYKEPEVVNGTIIEKLDNGAIVKGNLVSGTGENAYSLGWFRSGYTINGANDIWLKTGDIVTVSADVTLLKTTNNSNKSSMAIHLYPRSKGSNYNATKFTELELDKKIRVSDTFKISATSSSSYIYYPIFTLNGQTLKIENIQIAYGDHTEYEPYNKYKLPLKVDDEIYNIYMNEPLKKAGDYEDVIDLKTGKLVRNVGKTIFTGKETWYREEYRLFTYTQALSTNASSKKGCISNYFKGYTWDNLWQNSNRTEGNRVIGTALQGSAVINVTPSQVIPTVEEWKAKLQEWNNSGIPLTVYHAISPIEESVILPNIYSINPDIEISLGSTVQATIITE